MKIERKNRRYIFNILILILSIMFLKSGVIEKIDARIEENQLNKVKNITIADNTIYGNNGSNINNYGLVAATEDSVFYIKEMGIYKSDKNFNHEEVLITEPKEQGKDSLNIIGEWVFFRQGKEIKRMKNDGKNVDRIFKGYSLRMYVIGNKIYFINVSDNGKLYTMDVNGKNREVLIDKDIYDMSIYNDKIYYSYEYDKEYYLKKMNLDGSGKEFIANIKARNMVVDKGYIYYVDDEDEKLHRLELQNNSVELLSDKKILKFALDDDWIFYAIKGGEDFHSRFKGLYRMDTDGKNVLSLDEEAYLSEVGLGIIDDWVFYVSSNGTESPILKRIQKDGTGNIITFPNIVY